MEASEVYKRYKSAKNCFFEELSNIQKEYISSRYQFKEGDIVRFKNIHYKEPTLIVIEKMYFVNSGNFANEESFKYPNIQVSGHMVDEQGYDKTYFPNSLNSQPIGVLCSANDVIEINNIRPKALR